ncbi:MAG TPA: Hsp20/alpha crystallin family protein [Phycisphaerae bacterium]|nr:Hsp20/alpha crystallin family protein [Phycisphaerae bacterium]
MAVPWWRGGVDPLWGLRAMNREVARLLNLPEPGAFPPVNVYDSDEEMVVEALLPGVGTSELDVTVTGDSLTIKGTKPEPPDVPEGRFARRERGSGSFSRTVRLPEHPDGDRVKAVYRDGIVTVRLAKSQSSRPRRVSVETS